MSKFFCIIGFALITIASARVVRDAPQIELTFENLFKSAQEGLKHFEKVVLDTFGASDSEDLRKKAEQQGEVLAKQLDTWTDNIKKETEELKELSAVKELRETVDKAIEDFKVQHPQTANDIKEYIEKANKGTEEIVAKIKTLAESKEAENIKMLSEKLVTSAKDAFTKLATSITENMNKS